MSTMKAMVGAGYDTVVLMHKDGTVRRESLNSLMNPSRDVQRFVGNDLDRVMNTVGMYYEFHTYVSIGSRKELVTVRSGVHFIDGIVYSRNRVEKFQDGALRDALLNMMDSAGAGYVVESKGSWDTFNNVKDRLISVW